MCAKVCLSRGDRRFDSKSSVTRARRWFVFVVRLLILGSMMEGKAGSSWMKKSRARRNQSASHRITYLRCVRTAHAMRADPAGPIILHILSGLGSPDHLFGKQATLNLTLYESESERRRVDPNTCACACLPDGGMDGAAERLAFRDQVEVAQRFVPPI